MKQANNLIFRASDGGRKAAGYKGYTGDCAVRAIAIATGKPYKEVYIEMRNKMKIYIATHNNRFTRRFCKASDSFSPRRGVLVQVATPYLWALGWEYKPLFRQGYKGKMVYLRYGKPSELPDSTIICTLMRHWVTVQHGVIRDSTIDYYSDAEAYRVYGYWYKLNKNKK